MDKHNSLTLLPLNIILKSAEYCLHVYSCCFKDVTNSLRKLTWSNALIASTKTNQLPLHYKVRFVIELCFLKGSCLTKPHLYNMMGECKTQVSNSKIWIEKHKTRVYAQPFTLALHSAIHVTLSVVVLHSIIYFTFNLVLPSAIKVSQY
jgi:hypothetical protein